MNPENHVMNLEADSGAEQTYVCPEEHCGRRIVFNRAGELVVLQQGVFAALHTGGGIAMTGVAISQP